MERCSPPIKWEHDHESDTTQIHRHHIWQWSCVGDGDNPLRSQPVRTRIVVDADMMVWRSAVDSWRDPRGNPLLKDRRSFNVDVALPWMDEAGVDRAVVTPQSPDGNKFILEATKRHPDRFAAMGSFACATEIGRTVSKVAGTAGHARPFRFTPPVCRTITRVKNGAYDWFWAAAEKYELPVLVKTIAAMPIDPIVERHPDLAFILTVWSSPNFVLPHLVPRLVSLAKYPNISVTLSNILDASRQHYPFRDVADPLRRVFDAYGPQRFHWGSGAPNHFRRSSLQQRITHYTEELSFLSENDKDWVMGRAIMERLKWS